LNKSWLEDFYYGTNCLGCLISYNKFIKLQCFIIVFVDVSATAAAFVRTTVRQV